MRWLVVILLVGEMGLLPAHHALASASSARAAKVRREDPPPKPKPHDVSQAATRSSRPSSVGPSRWYSGTVTYPGGDRDEWRYFAPSLRPRGGSRR